MRVKPASGVTIRPMTLLVMILLVGAFVLFVLAAINVNSPRFNLIGGGLACLTLAYLLTHWPK
jgi:uncharacterized integral membrane protein